MNIGAGEVVVVLWLVVPVVVLYAVVRLAVRHGIRYAHRDED